MCRHLECMKCNIFHALFTYLLLLSSLERIMTTVLLIKIVNSYSEIKCSQKSENRSTFVFIKTLEKFFTSPHFASKPIIVGLSGAQCLISFVLGKLEVHGCSAMLHNRCAVQQISPLTIAARGFLPSELAKFTALAEQVHQPWSLCL